MKPTISRAVLFITLYLSTTFAWSENDEEKEFIKAQNIFEQSLAGDEDKTEIAIDAFQSLTSNNPEQPLFLAYLGSAFTLKARDSWMPWTRLRNVETGLEKIDKAILMLNAKHDEQKMRGTTISNETRLVAISTFLQIPGFFNRFQDAKDLLDEAVNSSVYESSPRMVKGRLQLWAAEIALREENLNASRDHLKQAVALLPPGRFSDKARNQLAERDRNEANAALDKELE